MMRCTGRFGGRFDSMLIVVAVADHSGGSNSGGSNSGGCDSGGGDSFGWLFSQCRESIFTVVVVAADVAWLLRVDEFSLKLFEDTILNHLTASGVDGMGDVGVKFGPSFIVFDRPFFVELGSTLAAEECAQMVF